MAVNPKRKSSGAFRVPASATLRAVVKRAAAQDEHSVAAWIRIVLIATLRKRGMWPPPEDVATDDAAGDAVT